MKIEDIYQKFRDLDGKFSRDSRVEQHGSMYFAMKGERFDGNDFTEEAFENGAEIAVVDHEKFREIKDPRYIWVPNVLETFQELAKMHRDNFQIPVIVIGGSNGKTTTKDLITAVLSKNYNVLSSEKSFNNDFGVPSTLMQLHGDHDIAVLEVGANHLTENYRLTKMVAPDHILLTNISNDHIGEYGGYEAVVEGNLEFYDYAKENKLKVFINPKDEMLTKHAEDLERIEYVGGEVVDASDLLKANILDKEIQTQLVGDYNLDNLRAAFTVGKYFDVEDEKIVEALEEFKPKTLRSQKLELDSNEVILDAYNANPTSMELALRNFKNMTNKKSRKIVILGDMFDLGEFGTKEHTKVVGLVRELGFDMVYYAGNDFYAVKDNDIEFFETTDDLAKHIKENPIEDSQIFLKASRGMELERVIDLK